MIGVVASYDRRVGWGFIIPDDGDLPDFFVHYSFIQADKFQRFLRVGQKVEFDPTDVDGKPQARNVRKLPTLIAHQTSAPAASGVRR
jgi:cold shock CspA family protein